MARTRTKFVRDGARRLNEWVGPPEQGFIAVTSTASVIISSLSVEEAIMIVRTRGMIGIKPSFGAPLECIGAIGVGIVSAEVLSVGITAIPTLYSDADWGGWLMWESFVFTVDFDDATGVRFGTIQLNIDSKGMRKAGSNEAFVMVVESQLGAFEVADATRQLFKLA